MVSGDHRFRQQLEVGQRRGELRVTALPGPNRNAWVHGLYSRRLQQCGDHCPLWQHCPMAGPDGFPGRHPKPAPG